jgi:nitrite reductase/ring-hydroxylating ferredoxin subunit
MAEAERLICRRDMLTDGGLATLVHLEFDGRTLPAFVVAYDGDVFSYVNSCPHRGTKLDWQVGEVFDDAGLYLVCATHGALFAPDTGRCVGGPCQGALLPKVAIEVINGDVFLRTGRLIHLPGQAASNSPSSP